MHSEQNGEVSQEKKSTESLVERVNRLVKATSPEKTTQGKKYRFTKLAGTGLFHLIEK